MMNNKYVTSAIFITLVASIAALSLLCYNKERTLDLFVKDYQKLSGLAAIVSNKLTEICSTEYKLNDFLIEDINGESIKVSQILNDKPKLFFRFSTFYCDACYESQLEIMSDLLSEYDDLIMLINSDANMRQINMINNRHSVKASIYKLVDNNLSMPIDSIRKPYYFKLSQDLIPVDCFIPDKGLPELSIQYFRRLIHSQDR